MMMTVLLYTAAILLVLAAIGIAVEGVGKARDFVCAQRHPPAPGLTRAARWARIADATREDAL